MPGTVIFEDGVEQWHQRLGEGKGLSSVYSVTIGSTLGTVAVRSAQEGIALLSSGTL